MSIIGWNLILVISKWVIIGLIYSVLLVLLIAVRREMFQRLAGKQLEGSNALGRLKVLNPGGCTVLHTGSLVGLRRDTSLGAESDNDIYLNDPYISSHHARLSWDGAGWWVEDLGSRNGTFVDGRPCPHHSPQKITAGSQLQVGGVMFELLELDE